MRLMRMLVAKMFLLGEAWGEQEAYEGKPFVGPSGHILNSMLRQVGISRDECYLSNVFNLQPQPKNDIINLCGPKSEGIPGMPVLSKGKYVRAEYAPELQRLYKEVERERPNVIVALGATAAWALCGTTGIRNIRGAPLTSRQGVKVLPTYHPAAIMRDWSLRPTVLSDLTKAVREQEYPDIRRPQRFIHIEPSLNDLVDFEREFIDSSPTLSADIETFDVQITCIGFAPSIDRCLVVPFVDMARPGNNYWRTLDEELVAWEWVRRQCLKQRKFIFQNGLYDIHILWRQYGITVPWADEDTMLKHHAMQPEMEKSLGYLGSIYTDEQQWKFMRKKHETLKKED